MANVLQEQIDILYAEAVNAGTLTSFLLAALALVIAGMFAGISAAIFALIYELAKDNIQFDQPFWDDVKCIAYCRLSPTGLFDAVIVQNIIDDLNARADELDDVRYTVVAQFIGLIRINGINYTERVDPVAGADCSACDCGGDWVVRFVASDLALVWSILDGTLVGSGEGSYIRGVLQPDDAYDYSIVFNVMQAVTITQVRVNHTGSSQSKGTEVQVATKQPFSIVLDANFQPDGVNQTINQDIAPPVTFNEQIGIFGNWSDPDPRFFWVEVWGTGYIPPEWTPYQQ